MCGSAAWLFYCHTDATSSQIATYTTIAGSNTVTYSYTYDDNRNILSVVSNISNANSNTGTSSTTTYEYDSANQLIRENNEAADYTHTWTYDNAGNILQRKEYDYTDGSLTNVTVDDSVSYGYPAVTDPENNAVWGDKLTSYGDKAITYDQIGNPLSFGNRTYTWEHGRQLATLTQSGTTWDYTYDAGGMRTGRTDGTTTYSYIYAGSQLAQMKVGSNTLNFTYDASGVPLTVTYNGTKYYYTTNIQGDVVAILDSNGTQVASYTYDAWGNCLTAPTSGVGLHNPLRYRGYVYDRETELYYLQSRYYDPEVGRFVNADGFTTTGQGFTGNNMFAYCGNQPVSNFDPSGNFYISTEQRSASGCSVRGRLPRSSPRKDLADAPDLDISTASPDSYACYGNGIGKQTVAHPTGYHPGDSTRKTFNAVINDLGEDNVRELNSIDDPIDPDEFKVAMKCGPKDYHFIRLDDNGWYNKSGRLPGLYIDQSMVTNEFWLALWLDNGQAYYGDPRDGFPYYDDETIYFAIKTGWDEQ